MGLWQFICFPFGSLTAWEGLDSHCPQLKGRISHNQTCNVNCLETEHPRLGEFRDHSRPWESPGDQPFESYILAHSVQVPKRGRREQGTFPSLAALQWGEISRDAQSQFVNLSSHNGGRIAQFPVGHLNKSQIFKSCDTADIPAQVERNGISHIVTDGRVTKPGLRWGLG